jgi:hypothetical protein
MFVAWEHLMIVLDYLVVVAALLVAQSAAPPSLTFDPAVAGAPNVHWTITLSAPYCGGYGIGDGVYLQPEAPLTLPTTVPSDSVLFDGQPAAVSVQDGVLRVAPSPTLVQSQICLPGDRPFAVELLPSLGLSNPDAGEYTVDTWIGSGGTPLKLTVDVGPAAAQSATSGCEPMQRSVDAATSALQVANAAFAKTSDDIRAQTAPLTSQAPELATTQTELVRQLDEVRATGEANRTNGWNPAIGYAAPASDWAQMSASGVLDALQQGVAGPDGAPRPAVATVVSLVQLAQQQAEDGATVSQHLMDVLQQLGDCGLGVPPAP